MHNYEITSNNEVLIFEPGNATGVPLIKQPHWPDGTPWASKLQAEVWAKTFVASRDEPDYEFEPGFTPSEPLIAKLPNLPDENLIEE